jgi:predicted PurR-regulated permease PerM
MKKTLDTHYKLIIFAVLSVIAISFFHSVIPTVFIAFSIAVIVEPMYLKLLKYFQKTKYNTSFWSEVILALFILMLTFLIIMIVVIPFYYLQSNIGYIFYFVSKAFDFVNESVLRTVIPLENVQPLLVDGLTNTATYLATYFAKIPKHMVSILIFYISLFGFIKYFYFLRRDILSVIPYPWKRLIMKLYLKSYILFKSFYLVQLLISVIVFFIALVFLYFIKIKGFLFLALITSLFQLIPFVGAASMIFLLIVYSFLIKNYIMLFVLLFVGYPLLVIIPEMAIRPWLMGKHSNIPMILLLLGILIGIKSMGIIGLILGPLMLVLFVEAFQVMKEKYGKNPINNYR